ncbi:zinc finger CCCH domain-containing protein 7B-like [Neolamprologus brichardi]|uniref:zinc finger CCCH domain-containing protein 7B-like n=1 Tax=Neolamprologus brichardi TaxID=32507 RepID=UPI001643BA13|nr:zinc finger CCCH domain-containing protein 7B-like [Neolamprologus brichardi]
MSALVGRAVVTHGRLSCHVTAACNGEEDFLTQLVCNLLDEGNAFFRDGQCEQAVKEFSEGLNVSCYAETEEIKIPEALLESLYVNRAAVYHSLGEYEQGVLDCNSALEVCKDSRRALYKKALCLKGLGKYKEAYDCSASYLLINPQDQQVNELAQELANHLGLKIRKPYVSTKMSGGNVENGNSVAPVNFPSVPQSSFPSTPTSCSTPTNSAVPERAGTIEDSELMGDDIDSLLDCVSTEPETAEDVFSVPSGTSTCTQRGPSVLPAPTPQLPPAFFSSAVNQLNSLDSFSGSGLGTSAATLDILDDLSTSEKGGVADASNLLLTPTKLDGLDSLDSLDDALDKMPKAAAAEEVIEAKTELDVGEKSLDELLDELDPLETCSSGISGSHIIAAPVMRSPKNHYKEKENQRPGAVYNPLSSTHEFLQACSACYPREGVGIYTYVHKPDLVHNCKRDILLCRLKADPPLDWTRVRPLPILKAFGGRFVLCKEKCTFAYNQMEIDVWTEEKKGRLDRNRLFGTKSFKLDPVSSIICLLQENKGTFMFLCQACYDSKPRIISKRFQDIQTICSNLDVRHNFDANKCLAFVVRTHNVIYKKMCAQILEKRKCNYSGVCTFAHSPEEKDMWMYMKNNDLKDMQQMYDMWLELRGYNRQADGSTVNQPSPEEKYITMPTDYAEPMSGFHCRLCGKHSNSERQWQQHISTEKHKDRVFSCEGEDEALTWSYRFPGTRFELCSKLDGSCPDGACCDYAHSPEELQEWIERREFLRQKLAKAREDMLVMPDEVDFGKYNFLLQD